MPEILIIDDDAAVRRSLELHLKGRGLAVHSAGNLADGRDLWDREDPDLVILDLMLPDGEGMDLLREHEGEAGSAKVIMITGHQDMERASEAIRLGAFDYVHKPVGADELDRVLDRALAQLVEEQRSTLEAESAAGDDPHRIVGRSRAVLELHKAIGRASRGSAGVLIRGESGTGKELVARAIHRNLAPEEPFVAVNCSALVPTLLESELFGHERGAFTGASQRRLGRLELAGQGLLFLDEIGDLSLELQAKLLRVVQEREFERVGGGRALPFRATLVVATHRDLMAMVSAGDFREDLYFRLRVLEITVPPLRERREDIPILVEHFLSRFNRQLHRRVNRVPENLIEQLLAYNWPGNVRELENRVLAGHMASSGEMLQMDVPEALPAGDPGSLSLKDVEARHIARVLDDVNWNFGRACEILGVSRPTLRKKIRDYELKDNSR